MQTETVEIKSKGSVLDTFEYDAPESLEEAIDVDTEEKVLKFYLMKRKSNFMDGKRRELTGGGLPKVITDALKSLDPDQLKRIAEQLGVDVS